MNSTEDILFASNLWNSIWMFIFDIKINNVEVLGKIKVLGGDQLRPNIHIKDMSRIYIEIIEAEKKLVNGEIFNAGYDNMSVNEIANSVKKIIGNDVLIEREVTNDNRSYHISSDKIKKTLNFQPKYSIENAIIDLKLAFEENKLPSSLDNSSSIGESCLQGPHHSAQKSTKTGWVLLSTSFSNESSLISLVIKFSYNYKYQTIQYPRTRRQ